MARPQLSAQLIILEVPVSVCQPIRFGAHKAKGTNPGLQAHTWFYSAGTPAKQTVLPCPDLRGKSLKKCNGPSYCLFLFIKIHTTLEHSWMWICLPGRKYLYKLKTTFYRKSSNFWDILKVTKDLKPNTGWNICQTNKLKLVWINVMMIVISQRIWISQTQRSMCLCSYSKSKNKPE